MSSVENTRPNCAASYSRPSSSPHSPPTFTQSSIPRRASGADDASCAASFMVSASSSAAGTTRLTMPSWRARSAPIGAPVRHSSSVAARPHSRSRRWVPPKPGIRPRLISGCPTLAVSAAIRRWQHIASSSPPPRAKPLTIAITGLGRRSTRRIIRVPRSEKSRPCTGVSAFISAMSAPATNALGPAPVSTTTRTVSSAAAAAKAASRASRVAALSAFSLSGRFTRRVRMPSASSTRRSGSVIGVLFRGRTGGRELPPRRAGQATCFGGDAAPWPVS